MGARTARTVQQLGYRLVKQGTIFQFPARTKDSSLLQKHPNQLWRPPSLLITGYLEFFPWGYSDCGMKLTL